MAEQVFKCCKCGKTSPVYKGAFYRNKSDWYKSNDQVLHMCQDCCADLFMEYYNESSDDRAAMRRFCLIFDYYYSDEVVGERDLHGIDYFKFYMGHINMNQYKNKWSKDTQKEDAASAEVVKSVGGKLASTNPRIIKATKLFGNGFTAEEFGFLLDEYEEWCELHESQTKSQEELFKILSLGQLRIRRRQNSGDSKELDDAIKSFQTTLGTANLQPKQNKKDIATNKENNLGSLIKLWEDNDPIPEVDEDFKDIDGIKRYIMTWFTGHLCKMLGIKNPNAVGYEREKRKYHVEEIKIDYNDDEQEEDANIRDALKVAMHGGSSNGN